MSAPIKDDVVGHLDRYDGDRLFGWACNRTAPDRPLNVDIYYGDTFVARTQASLYREDLRAAGLGEGCCAFILHLPRYLRQNAVSAERFRAAAAAPRRVWLTPLPIATQKTIDDPQSPTLVAEHPRTRPEDELGEFLRALLRAPCLERASATPMFGRLGDRLFERQTAFSLSRLSVHLAHSFGKGALIEDPVAFWRWYLTSLEIRGTSPDLLLADFERAYLSANGQGATMRVVELLSGRPVGTSVQLANERQERRLARCNYSWAIDRVVHEGWPSDLVNRTTVAALRDPRGLGRLMSFPLTRFIELLIDDNAALQLISPKGARERARLYAAILIMALRFPPYIRFLPPLWVGRLVASDRARRLQSICVDLVGEEGIAAAERITKVVQSTQAATAPRREPDTNADLARLRNRLYSSSKAKRPDIQMIGPFRRSLGLAESCRRFAGALRIRYPEITFADCDTRFDSPARPPGFDLQPLRPASINIIHLNAEEWPRLLVQNPGVFAASINILVPYFELSRPSAVHELGLQLADQVWAASQYLQSVFSQMTDKVRLVGLPPDDRTTPNHNEARRALLTLGFEASDFVFMTSADALSPAQRKNVLGAVKAFGSAFPAGRDNCGKRNPRLLVKTHNLARHEGKHPVWQEIAALCAADARITLIDRSLDDFAQRQLLKGCDCFVSLHRAEGVGLDILDALNIGTPVVATGYSGNMDICDDSTAWLVNYELVAVAPQDYVFVEPGHVWAEPDHASAVAALRAVFADRTAREAKSAAGQIRVSGTGAWLRFDAAIAAAMASAIEAARPSKP